MISQQTIDQIFSAIRVEEVISDFVTLKKSGSNLKGLSPFTDEKSPSFMVSPSKGIWKDFSSGKGGNAVSFLMEAENYTYPEALRYLANKYNIQIEEEIKPNLEQLEAKEEKERLYQFTDFAKNYFVDQLHNSQEGQAIGLSYFKERGLSAESIKNFSLGYSPKQKDALYQFATKKGYKEDVLIQSGVCVVGEDFKADRFRERVIFPIFSFSGRCLGFGGRILSSNTKTAKYLNSPENPIYHKSQSLFGLYQAKNFIAKKDQCVLVEGYTDVISMHQKGIQNVVSSSGTALTTEQIGMIRRLTHNIVLVFDSDAAGIRASFRGIDLILAQGMHVKVLTLPKGEDPDSFAQKNTSEFLQDYLSEEPTDFISFKSAFLMEESGGDPSKKAELIRDILQSISLISSPIERELYVQKTASILEVSTQVLYAELNQILGTANRVKPKAPQTEPLIISKKTEEPQNKLSTHQSLIERELIKFMLTSGDRQVELKSIEDPTLSYQTTVNGEIIGALEVDQMSLQNPLYKEIFDQIKESFKTNNVHLKAENFLQSQNQEIVSFIADIQLEDHQLSPTSEYKEGIVIRSDKKLLDLLYRYKSITVELLIESKQQQLKESSNAKGDSSENPLLQIQKLIGLKNTLYQLLNRVV
ncbi:MAG: DNA primase [Flavobacteriaceae bacterium]|nr:MAG: DNA primase [Flavobacteriaceae bacterium]